MPEPMADAKAQVEMARVALRRAIAGALVRQEQAEEQLQRLRPVLEARRSDRAVAEAAGDSALMAEIDQAVSLLESEIENHEGALAMAQNDVAGLKEELKDMDGLEREAERLAAVTEVRDASEPPSVVQATLDRVRASIGALEAQANLNDELARDAGLERKLEAAATEAAAKAKLAELKAAAAGRLNGDGDDDNDAPPKKKKTL